jgi:hypothetical protein
MSKYKLDLFKTLLPALDKHDLDAYANWTPEERKGFSGVLAMRALSDAPGDYGDWYLMAVNQISNQRFFDLSAHPELQYKLLASCGVGHRVNHSWIGASKKGSDAALRDFISRFWPRADSLEIDIVLSRFDKKTFGEFVDGSGVDDDESKKLKKTFSDRAAA